MSFLLVKRYQTKSELRASSAVSGCVYSAKKVASAVNEKDLIGFAAEKRAGSGPRRGRKLMRPLGELSRNVTFWDGAGGPERRVLWQAFRPPGDGLFGYGVCISVLAVVLRAMAHQC